MMLCQILVFILLSKLNFYLPVYSYDHLRQVLLFGVLYFSKVSVITLNFVSTCAAESGLSGFLITVKG